MKIKIDGKLYKVKKIIFNQVQNILLNQGGFAEIEVEEKEYFYLAESHKSASYYVRNYYDDMIDSNPSGIISIVGEKTLIQFALGNDSEGFDNLMDWLDYQEDNPEEYLSYEGRELEVERCGVLARELDWMPQYAYKQ